MFISNHPLGTGKPIDKNLWLTKIKVSLKDSIFNGFMPYLEKEEQFLEKHEYVDFNFLNATFSVKVLLNEQEKTFKRQVYSLLELIGDIGGLLEGLKLITGSFIAFYNLSMFESALVKTLFKFSNMVKLP